MMKFQRVNGVTLDRANGLPTIVQTPEGRAMGAVPGWIDYMDPDYVDIAGKTVRNRARARTHSFSDLDNLHLGVFSNGETCFFNEDDIGSVLRVNPASGVDLDPRNWSFVFVALPIEGAGPDDYNLVRANAAGTTEELGLRVAIRRETGEFQVNALSQPSNASTRIQADLDLINKGKVSLLMATFSIKNGLNLFCNGELVASNPNDKRQITYGLSADDRSYFRGARGKYGVAATLNIDLSLPENSGYRRSMESFLMEKYGIEAAS